MNIKSIVWASVINKDYVSKWFLNRSIKQNIVSSEVGIGIGEDMQ